MTLSPLDLAENIYRTGSRTDVQQLIQVLQSYLTKADPVKSIRADKDAITKKLLEKRATASEVYLVSPQSVCPCCRR